MEMITPVEQQKKSRAKERRKRYSLRAVIAAAVLTFALTVVGAAAVVWNVIGPDGVTLLQGLALINSGFVGPYETQEVVDAAMRGMVTGLNDRWSFYLDAEGYESLQVSRDNSYVGIGVTISYEREEGIEILSVVKDGPADRAGVLPGEIIIGVDGVSIAGEARHEGVSLVRGEEGTEVSLELLAPGGSTRVVPVVRSRVEEAPVRYELLEGDVGLITLKNFYNRSADRLKAATDDLIAQGAKSLVFDLRNNPGGYLTELTAMLDYLLPEGPIFRSQNRAGNEEVTESDAACVDVPMAVLVNKDTYSAAEFFAAELRERDWAVVAGTQTCGKGYAQQTFPLPGGGALNISTSKYFTGGGVSLIGTGLVPDPYVELGDEEENLLRAGTLAHERDGQLQAALSALSGEERMQ